VNHSRNRKAKLIPARSLLEKENQTDLANSRRFIDAFGDRLRYCHQWKKWLVFDGVRWKPDGDGAVMRLGKSIADAIWKEARLTDNRDALRHAARTASDSGVRALIAMAESECPVSADELDANTFLLNCPNCTIDLRTGTCRPHRREDLLTKLCPTEFDPSAVAPTWERFQREVANDDASLVAFKQRLYGYAATGDVREHALPIFHGSGSNGKSTELETVVAVFGDDYAGAAPKDLLMAKKGDSHPTEIADLHGKRLVVSQETEANRYLAESLVKQLTGGDTLKARRMREDFWSFRPSHKLILCTNHKPKVRGTDHAIWRRLKLIPFAVRFDGARKDKTMKDRLLAERAGILAWIVRGAVEWYRGGLMEPDSVLAATAEYRTDSDIIGRFIIDCCIRSEMYRVRFSLFFELLERWCADSGNTPPSKRATTEYLRDNGFREVMNNGLWFAGLGCKTNSPTE
jgi:putative DNA primase/helicase